MKKIILTGILFLVIVMLLPFEAKAVSLVPMKNGTTYIFGDNGEAYWMFSKVLEKVDPETDMIKALTKTGAIYSAQLDENKKKILIAQLSGYDGVLVSTEGLVVGGKLDKVKSAKVESYYNKNCYIIFNNGTFNETGTDLLDNNDIVDYRTNAVWDKQGNTVGKIKGTGMVYDNELKNVIGYVDRCVNIRVLKNNDPQKVKKFISILIGK